MGGPVRTRAQKDKRNEQQRKRRLNPEVRQKHAAQERERQRVKRLEAQLKDDELRHLRERNAVFAATVKCVA